MMRWLLTVALTFIGLSASPVEAQLDGTSDHRGGEVTIITGHRNDTALVRSTRFR